MEVAVLTSQSLTVLWVLGLSGRKAIVFLSIGRIDDVTRCMLGGSIGRIDDVTRCMPGGRYRIDDVTRCMPGGSIGRINDVTR